MELRDTGVLVTGASRGIGRAMAEAFAAEGARLVLVARSGAPLKELADRLGAHAHPADLTDPGQVDGLIDRLEIEAGAIDVVVNNAGIDATGPLVDQSPEDLEALFRLNLMAPAELCRQAIPRMLSRGRGHVVNVGSLAGIGVFPGIAGYAATKAGIAQFTAGLRADLRGLPVGTTLVELGPVETSMLEHAEGYTPTHRSFQRFRHLQLLVDISPLTVADAVVDAVRRNRPHVRLPKRVATFAMLPEVPRRLTQWLLTGVPHQAG